MFRAAWIVRFFFLDQNFKMGVVLRNLQKVVFLRRARLRKDVDTLRHILGVHKFDMGIICVDNRRIQQINNMYRKKNVPTDVLSFPFYEVNMTSASMGHTELNVSPLVIECDIINFKSQL